MSILRYKWLVIYVLIGVITILLLLTHALNNGFPLIYSDTGGYILSGMKHNVPLDRPLMYGLLIWASGMGISLWQVAVLQALMVVYLLWLLLKCVTGSNRMSFFILPVLALILIGTTGVSFYISFLIPDIMAAITIAGVLLLIAYPEIKKSHRITLIIIIVISTLTHYSNFVNILSVALVFFFIFLFFRKKTFVVQRKKSFYLVIITVILSLLLNSLLPKFFTVEDNAAKSNYGHPFATLLESGLVHEYLSENCEDTSYYFCKHINELPRNHGYFLWDLNSLLYRDCGSVNNCRGVRDEEMKAIIFGMLSDPCYLQGISAFAIQRTWNQLFHFDVITLSSYREEYPIRIAIRKNFPADLNAFLSSCQNNNGYGLSCYNDFYRLIIYTSFLFVLVILILPSTRKRIHTGIKVFFWLFLVTLLSNAFVCSVLSSGNSRYQGRIIWIIPLIGILIITELLLQKYKKRKSDNA